MEDVLEVYQRQYGDNEVLVCLDETSKQQVKETRLPRPARPGAAGIYDYEYERNGVSNMFMLFAPLEGWRRVEVTDRRTKVDWARVVRKLVDEDYATTWYMASCSGLQVTMVMKILIKSSDLHRRRTRANRQLVSPYYSGNQVKG